MLQGKEHPHESSKARTNEKEVLLVGKQMGQSFHPFINVPLKVRNDHFRISILEKEGLCPFAAALKTMDEYFVHCPALYS